jgi:hypothetical protein
MPAVVVVVVMIIVSVLVHPQHALDAANYATGHPARQHRPRLRRPVQPLNNRCGLLAAHPLRRLELAPKEAL